MYTVSHTEISNYKYTVHVHTDYHLYKLCMYTVSHTEIHVSN